MKSLHQLTCEINREVPKDPVLEPIMHVTFDDDDHMKLVPTNVEKIDNVFEEYLPTKT